MIYLDLNGKYGTSKVLYKNEEHLESHACHLSKSITDFKGWNSLCDAYAAERIQMNLPFITFTAHLGTPHEVTCGKFLSVSGQCDCVYSKQGDLFGDDLFGSDIVGKTLDPEHTCEESNQLLFREGKGERWSFCIHCGKWMREFGRNKSKS